MTSGDGKCGSLLGWDGVSVGEGILMDRHDMLSIGVRDHRQMNALFASDAFTSLVCQAQERQPLYTRCYGCWRKNEIKEICQSLHLSK